MWKTWGLWEMCKAYEMCVAVLSIFFIQNSFCMAYVWWFKLEMCIATYIGLNNVAPFVVEFFLELQYICQILVNLSIIRFFWKSVEHFLGYKWMDKHGKANRCICVSFHCEYVPPHHPHPTKKLLKNNKKDTILMWSCSICMQNLFC